MVTKGSLGLSQIRRCGTHENHYYCGGTDCAHNDLPFENATAITSAEALLAAGSGNYYLSDNITLSKTESWTPANGTVLCLNGKTIRANGAGAAITVAQGEARFTDVPTSAYYAKAVAWAQKQDITDGVSQFRFAPEHDCTRAQIVTFLYRAFAE